jgi:gluconokinase
MNQTCTLGVDIGTTSVKVVAFSTNGRELSRASQRLTLLKEQPAWAEQDAEEVYRAVEHCILDVVRRLQPDGWTVERVGFSAAMHSLLAVDEQGRPLTPAMTWMDTRAAAQAEQLWASSEGIGIYQATGTPIHPMAPLAKLMWLKEHRPALLRQAFKFVSLKEYVWYRWFGVWEIDASMASATGLYDIAHKDWLPGALELAGVGVNQLSTIVPTTHVRSELKAQPLCSTGMFDHAQFNIGASDGVLANLGAGVTESGDMVVTIGTSCAVRTGTRQMVTDAQTRSFCYVLDDGYFVVGGPSNSGGVVVDWLYRQVLSGSVDGSETGDKAALDALLAQAEQVNVDDLLFLPYVAGERAPLWNPDATSTVVGLKLSHTRVHVLRAAVEGVLLNAYWIASALTREVGKPKRLLASGKLLEVPWIRQMAADIFGTEVVPATTADASVVGAVILAELASGKYGWEDVSLRHKQFQSADHIRVVYPNAEAHQKYQHKYAEFRRLAELLGLNKSS